MTHEEKAKEIVQKFKRYIPDETPESPSIQIEVQVAINKALSQARSEGYEEGLKDGKGYKRLEEEMILSTWNEAICWKPRNERSRLGECRDCPQNRGVETMRKINRTPNKVPDHEFKAFVLMKLDTLVDAVNDLYEENTCPKYEENIHPKQTQDPERKCGIHELPNIGCKVCMEWMSKGVGGAIGDFVINPKTGMLEKPEKEPECKCYHNAWEKVTRFCPVHQEPERKDEYGRGFDAGIRCTSCPSCGKGREMSPYCSNAFHFIPAEKEPKCEHEWCKHWQSITDSYGQHIWIPVGFKWENYTPDECPYCKAKRPEKPAKKEWLPCEACQRWAVEVVEKVAEPYCPSDQFLKMTDELIQRLREG